MCFVSKVSGNDKDHLSFLNGCKINEEKVSMIGKTSQAPKDGKTFEAGLWLGSASTSLEDGILRGQPRGKI